MSLSVLFICKKRTNNIKGFGFGLGNSANFVSEMLQNNNIKSSVILAIDGNYIDKIVTEYDPDIVILEAIWVTPSKMQELFSIKRHQKRKWIIRIHSRFSFLAHEGTAFSWLKGYKEVIKKFQNVKFIIAPNSKETTYNIQHNFNIPSVYLPNVYTSVNYEIEPKPQQKEGIVNIGCFGAIRPFKNHLTQAIAAIDFANRKNLNLRFHINADRCEQRGECVLNNLIAVFDMQNQHKLIKHEWMEHKDFIKIVRKMDIGMQVSFSETFNLVTADFVLCDIPIITSSQIKWMPKCFHADCNSTKSIIEILNYAWENNNTEAKKCLFKSNELAEIEWMNFVGH